MLFEQHPHIVQPRSRASGYWRPCSIRVRSASRVGTLPSFFRAGRRFYRSWTVHQCWCSISTVDSFSCLILAFVCHAYPAFVFHAVSPQNSTKICSLVLSFAFLRLYEPYNKSEKLKSPAGLSPGPNFGPLINRRECIFQLISHLRFCFSLLFLASSKRSVFITITILFGRYSSIVPGLETFFIKS